MKWKDQYIQMNYALFQIYNSVQMARFFSSRNLTFHKFPTAYLSSSGERAVDLSSLEGDGQVEGLVLQEGEAHIVLGTRGQNLI